MTEAEKTIAMEELNAMSVNMKRAHDKGEDITPYFYAVMAMENAFKKITGEQINYDHDKQRYYFAGVAIRYNPETCQFERV